LDDFGIAVNIRDLFNYSIRLTGKSRSNEYNLALGAWLAFVAGMVNSGGYLALKTYTSHMTGLVSSMADNLVLGEFELVSGAAIAVFSFLAGSMSTAILVSFARRRSLESLYAFPLLLEAILLLVFGAMASSFAVGSPFFWVSGVAVLAYMMGLQNAVITKVSGAVVRTTHVTGMITDLGIELGKLVYRNTGAREGQLPIVADRRKLMALTRLIGSFFAGGVVGAIGFLQLSVWFVLPISVLLFVLAIGPVYCDTSNWYTKKKREKFQ
jgi:uncharacterized membrane protein YoaK (UPF0700 family)